MKSKFTKWILGLILMPMIIILYYGCKKETSDFPTSKINNSELETIKNLYYKSEIEKLLTDKMPDNQEIIWRPDWKRSTLIKRDSSSYIYVRLIPIPKDKGSKLNITSDNFRQYLILKNGVEFQRAIYITKTDNKTELTSEFKFKNFNGTLILHHLKANKVNSYIFRNGNYVRRSFLMNKLATTRTQTGKMYWDTECEYKYYCTFVAYCGLEILLHYDDSGNCSAPDYPPSNIGGHSCFDDFWNHSSTDLDFVCAYVWVDDPPPNPGDDDTSNGDSQNTQDIINKVEDECLSKAVEKTVNSNVNGEISDILKKLDKDSKIQITVKDVDTITNGADGKTVNGLFTTNPDGSTKYEVTILLNKNTLAGYATGDVTSNEFAVAVIIHEALHAFFRATTGETDLKNMDHVNMAKNYVHPMAAYLSSIFGISALDATAISWQGLQGTDAFTKSPTFEVLEEGKIVTYNKKTISEIGTQYKINQKGTKLCD